MEISKKVFDEFENVRKSGRTNMFDIGGVQRCSGYRLSPDAIKTIIENYDELSKQFK